MKKLLLVLLSLGFYSCAGDTESITQENPCDSRENVCWEFTSVTPYDEFVCDATATEQLFCVSYLVIAKNSCNGEIGSGITPYERYQTIEVGDVWCYGLFERTFDN